MEICVNDLMEYLFAYGIILPCIFTASGFYVYLIMPMPMGMNSSFPEIVCSDTIGLLVHTNIASLPELVLYHLACF